MPTREEMIAALRSEEAPSHFGLKAGPDFFQERDLLGEGLGYLGRGLDYAGGIARTGLASLSGKVNKGDVAAALKGQAPSLDEYMGRMGIPEGPSVDLNPWAEGKTSARQAVGFLGEIATDPLTYIGMPGGSKALKGALPLSESAETLGKKMYKSGLKNVDKVVVEKGKKPVSDLLLEAGKTGSVEKLSKDAVDLNRDLLKTRKALYQEASDAGAIVDMTGAVSGARSKIAKLRENPGFRETADKLEAFLNKYEGEGFVDIQSVSDWKSALYDTLPQSAFGPNGKIKGPVKALERTLAKDFKLAIENAADEAAPGLGKKISQINEKMSSLLEAKKPFAVETKKSVTPNYLTSVDALLPGGLGVATGTASGDPVTGILSGLGLLGIKKAADAAKTTTFRTRGGKLLKDAGSSGLLDATARRGLIHANRDR